VVARVVFVRRRGAELPRARGVKGWFAVGSSYVVLSSGLGVIYSMRVACVSFWLHGPRSISRRCVPDMIEETAPFLLYPLRMLGTGHCCVRYGFPAAPERTACRPRDGLGTPASGSTFNVRSTYLHRLDLRLHRPSVPSSLFVPQVSLSPHLKTGY